MHYTKTSDNSCIARESFLLRQQQRTILSYATKTANDTPICPPWVTWLYRMNRYRVYRQKIKYTVSYTRTMSTKKQTNKLKYRVNQVRDKANYWTLETLQAIEWTFNTAAWTILSISNYSNTPLKITPLYQLLQQFSVRKLNSQIWILAHNKSRSFFIYIWLNLE